MEHDKCSVVPPLLRFLFFCLQAGDTSRCGEVMVESAYVKLCAGDMKEALFMFREVRDAAMNAKDDFLTQVCQPPPGNNVHGGQNLKASTKGDSFI